MIGEPETNNGHDNGFTDKTICKHFITKVYSILMCQLLVTVTFVAIVIYHEPTKWFMLDNYFLIIIVAFVVSIAVLITFACCDSLRREYPTNYILLVIFTVAESFLVGAFVSHYYPEQVLFALGLTTLVCFSLTVFAFQTKIDFTVFGGFLLVALIVLLVISIVAMFFPSKLMTIIIACAGVIIFSFHLIYDTQMMMVGKHKYSISPDEYIFASLSIYIDVINIFLYILAIIGATDD